jgi:hypothetical protein
MGGPGSGRRKGGGKLTNLSKNSRIAKKQIGKITGEKKITKSEVKATRSHFAKFKK